MKLKTAAAAVLCVFIAMNVNAEVPEYTVMRTTGKIVVDGVLDEEDWAKAESVGEFSFPWWTEGEKEQTEAKMLWDDDFLYVSFRCSDKHIWADHYSTNEATCIDDCAEIFWNPGDESSGMYYMFEMNCIGNLLSVYKNPLHKFTERESRIMVPRIGRTVQGSVNSDHDFDSGWILEVAIRFTDYPELSPSERPSDGDKWRVGLNRCGGKTNQQYSQWSPSQTARPNFHVPDDFGRIIFSSSPVGTEVGVLDIEEAVYPAPVVLRGNFPNPFNPSTSIRFSLADDAFVKLVIYNIADQAVRELVATAMQAGEHEVVWDGTDNSGTPVSSGIYLTRLTAGSSSVTGRMLLLK